MHNYKLTIQYDGTDFYGWQSQPNKNTVQDRIIEALKTITKEEINLIGSGRTDSGVHALGQVSNFHTNQKLNFFEFKYSLNSLLPNEISVVKIAEVEKDFHSRFDAKKRTYIYLISKKKSPFFYKYSYLKTNIDESYVKYLRELSKAFVGVNDFSSFSKTKSEAQSKICKVSEILWRDTKDFLIFKIAADRFLHGMVRTIVGTLLFAVDNRKDENYLKEILEMKDRRAAHKSISANGLFLFKVKY